MRQCERGGPSPNCHYDEEKEVRVGAHFSAPAVALAAAIVVAGGKRRDWTGSDSNHRRRDVVCARSLG